MTLLDAKEVDMRGAQRRKRLMTALAIVVAAGVVLWILWLVPIIPWLYRYWPEEHVVDKFFTAIEKKDFDTAYGIYNADPDWKQHPQKYSQYPPNQFYLDWGPSGDWGEITSHEIDCATEPEKKGFASPTGVIVVARINHRADGEASMWVEKKSKTLTTSPFPVLCHPPK